MLKNNLVIQKDNANTFFLKNDSYVKYIKFTDVAHPLISPPDGIDKLLTIIIDMMMTEVQNEIISVNEMEQADVALDLSVNSDKNEYHITEKIIKGALGTGTPEIVYNNASHYVDMNIKDITDPADTNVITRQSKAYVNIPSGKLNISLVSGVLLKSSSTSIAFVENLDPLLRAHNLPPGEIGSVGDTFTSKIGIFDDTDGLYIQYKATNNTSVLDDQFSIIKMFDGVATEVLQDNWNVDTCDTLGPSGIRLDAGEMNTFIYRCGTLPKTFMQVGVMHQGAAILIHEFNDSEYFVKLPIRWQVEQSSSAGSFTSALGMIQNNAVVLSNEKHFSQTKYYNYICRDNHFRKINETNPMDVLFDIRLNDVYKRSKIKLEKIHIINKETTGIVLWKLIRNGKIQEIENLVAGAGAGNGGTEYNPSPPVAQGTFTTTVSHANIITLNSVQQWNNVTESFDTTDYLEVVDNVVNTVNTTSLISSGYIYGNTVTEINLQSDTNIIFSDIDGVSDHLTLVAYYVNAPAELQATITWKEYE
jgi:hypothetical protein